MSHAVSVHFCTIGRTNSQQQHALYWYLIQRAFVIHPVRRRALRINWRLLRKKLLLSSAAVLLCSRGTFLPLHLLYLNLEPPLFLACEELTLRRFLLHYLLGRGGRERSPFVTIFSPLLYSTDCGRTLFRHAAEVKPGSKRFRIFPSFRFFSKLENASSLTFPPECCKWTAPFLGN